MILLSNNINQGKVERAYIFGAICPEQAVGAAIVTPAANTECMNLHLAEISTQVAPSSLAVLICDGAGWHQRSGKLRLPDNIVLLPLPPYTPELNAMENVWDYLRADKLSPGAWNNYKEIVDACADAWNWFVMIQPASAQSAQENGQQSMFKAIDVICFRINAVLRETIV